MNDVPDAGMVSGVSASSAINKIKIKKPKGR
jgi:hypothetical protein